MSAIAYYLERAGISTVGISLVRENTEALRPPRFLWVPFPLGRPLGAPNDPAFQHRVIRAALALLGRGSGPVLEDFPIEAPAAPGLEPQVCPVSFRRAPPDTSTWSGRLETEMRMLAPWYDVSLARRDRTLFGVAGASPDALRDELSAALAAEPAELDLRRLKLVLEDLKAWYQEAMTAQPGQLPWAEVRRLLWDETELGLAMRELAATLTATGHPLHNAFVRVLVPRAAR